MESGFFTKEKMMIPLAFEFIGSALMVAAFELSLVLPMMPYAFFLSWLLFAPISGCHLNPAISVAVFIMEKNFKDSKMIMYLVLELIVQLCGCYLGILLSYLVMQPEFRSMTVLFPASAKYYF